MSLLRMRSRSRQPRSRLLRHSGTGRHQNTNHRYRQQEPITNGTHSPPQYLVEIKQHITEPESNTRSLHRLSSPLLVTSFALHQTPEPRCASPLRRHPWPHRPGRIVPPVDAVSAFEPCHPMPLFILLKFDNRSLHRSLPTFIYSTKPLPR